MSTVVIPDTDRVEHEGVEDLLCHVYWQGEQTTHCGLHVSEDKHAMMHRGYGQISPRFQGAAIDSCPQCGTPVCLTCLQVSRR